MSEPLVIALVLSAAVMHAVWNALVKGDTDRTMALAAVLLVGALLGLVVVAARPLPAPAAWPWLFGSALTHTVYFTCLLGAYRTGDLGQVYPIARGTAPVLVAVATVALGSRIDPIAPLELAGAALVSLGIASLALGGVGAAQRRALWFALGTGCSIALYTLLDGTGARRSGDPLAYAGWSFVVQVPAVVVLTLIAGRERARAFMSNAWKRGVVGGVVAAGAWLIVIWAMTQVPIAHVAALRETSVIFAAAIGAVALREPFGVRRIAAATLVCAGIMIMRLV